MLLFVVLYQLVYYALYLFSDVIDLLVHYATLAWIHVLQLLEQLPQVHHAYLKFFLQLEHSERVLVERHSSECEQYVDDQYTYGHKVI